MNFTPLHNWAIVEIVALVVVVLVVVVVFVVVIVVFVVLCGKRGFSSRSADTQ